ncbi:MAG: orotidine-5'-phosphate decarboxylase [Clostridia bacterium]
MFADTLIKRIEAMGNPTAVGLDPDLSFLPAELLGRHSAPSRAVFAYNKEIIDHIYDMVPVVKCQSAYYEALGPEGAFCLKDTMDYAGNKGLIVILDGKRNDISSTAKAYARAYLDNGGYRCDALTVNPYLGYDGIQPFLEKCVEKDKGIFILVKTSNPSSSDLQDVILQSGKPLYEHVAVLVNTWSSRHKGTFGYGSAGAVVGATYPVVLKELRGLMKNTFFLVPGYGSQGAGAEDVMHAFDENGRGALVNASRSILCAWEKYGMKHMEFPLAARKEAQRMKDDLEKMLEYRRR